MPVPAQESEDLGRELTVLHRVTSATPGFPALVAVGLAEDNLNPFVCN